jgi:hypothetical protein
MLTLFNLNLKSKRIVNCRNSVISTKTENCNLVKTPQRPLVTSTSPFPAGKKSSVKGKNNKEPDGKRKSQRNPSTRLKQAKAPGTETAELS